MEALEATRAQSFIEAFANGVRAMDDDFQVWLARTIHEASAPGWSEHGLSVAG